MPLATATLIACAPLALAHTTDPTSVSTDGALDADTAIVRTFLDEPARLTLPPTPTPSPTPEGAALLCTDALDTGQAPDADLPRELAWLPDGSAVAIVNRDTDNVTFFDPTTLTITDTVAVGDFPTSIAASPDGQYVLTTNLLDNTVSVIDVATKAIAATVPVTGDQPYNVKVTADSTRAVVGVINDATDATFSIIDLNTLTETDSFPGGTQGIIGFFATPSFGIAGNIFTKWELTPNSQTIVLPQSFTGGGSVNLYDINTGTLDASLPIAQGANGLDIKDDGAIAAITLTSPSNQLVVVDLNTQTIANTFNVGHSSDGLIVVYPGADIAAIAQSSNIYFHSLTTGAQLSTTVSSFFGDLDITSDGNYIVGSNFNFRVFDAATFALVDTLPSQANAELAVSPVDNTVVALNNRFRENALVFTINGAASTFDGYALSGQPAEGDAPLEVNVSANGATAIVSHGISENVALLDLNTLSLTHVHTGDRVMDAALTPDGLTAVACNGDSDTVSIIDVPSANVVKTINIPGRPARVRIAPDGSMAYVLNIAGSDQVRFITLDGASSALVASVPAGQAGAWNGAAYAETSGVELSPDGSLFAVCDSFNDLLRLFDTTTMTQVAAVPTGDFPIQVAFLPDGSRAYVTNPFDDTVSVININGAASSNIGTITGLGDSTFTVAADNSGNYVYVGDYDFANGGTLFVISTASNSVIETLDLGELRIRKLVYSPDTNRLYAATTPSTNTPAALLRFSANGPFTQQIDSTPLSGSPLGAAFTPDQETALVANTNTDLLDVIRFDCSPGSSCTADFDNDGDVDSTDLNTLLAAFADPVNPGDPGDADGDGDVDSTDLNILLTQFGTDC